MNWLLARPTWNMAGYRQNETSGQTVEASASAVDVGLLEQLAAGNEAAFNSIVDRHYSLVFRVVVRVMGSAADAEDVTQEAFVKLWRSPPELRNQSALKAWIVKVARNLAIDRLRRNRDTTGDGLDQLEDASTAPDGILRHSEAAGKVAHLLNTLPERQRTALQLTYYEALGNQATADIMDISVGAVESLLSRARRTLRSSLEGQWEELIEELEQLK